MTISATTQGIKPGVCLSTNRPVNPFDGQVIYMTDVDQTAVWDGSQWTVLAPIAGGRNVVINGAMQVAQRGTTFTGLTSFQYSLDRWKSFRLSGAPYNISQQATSDTTNLPNIQYCARVGRANSNTDLQLVFFSQSFESLNSRAFAGKIATVSFYARKGANYSAASSALKVELNTGTGTDQDVINGFTGQASPINQTATLTTTWQRFTYTSTTLSSSMTQLAINFYYTPVGTAGAADYFEITGVQVEAGSVATPFEFEDYGTTLTKCQRYYWRFSTGSLWRNFATGTAVSSTTMYMVVPLPTTLRTNPTAIEWNQLRAYDGVNVYTVTAVSTTTAFASTGMAQLDVTGVGLATFRPYFLQTNDGGYLAVYAEL